MTSVSDFIIFIDGQDDDVVIVFTIKSPDNPSLSRTYSSFCDEVMLRAFAPAVQGFLRAFVELAAAVLASPN